ncbi:MAG: hypothetical protein AMJ55_00265 [Gammaproteobacteria bacterium SG8_15]|nr:MAG: hypothetical protein AMJ55_00265 [Gammaproteobacteria bacterium SG8_15]
MACIRTLEDFIGPTRTSGTQINFQFCPVCGSDKWKVYVDPVSGRWYCFAGGHSGGGRVEVGLPQEGVGRQILEQLNGNSRGESRTEWPEIQLPPFMELSSRAVRYLRARGLSDETIRFAKLVEWDHPDKLRVLFPFFGPEKQIIYWSSRTYSSLDQSPKYLTAPGKHPFYVLPEWRQEKERVVVEGVMDALAVYQWTRLPVLALCGKSLPRYLEAAFTSLITESARLLLDGDALRSSLRLRTRLSSRRDIRITPLPVGQDPADLGPELEEYLR